MNTLPLQRLALLPPLALALCLTACRDGQHHGSSPHAAQENTPSASAVPSSSAPDSAAPALSSDFSGGTAYRHCARLCDLGPRPSGSPAYAQQLDYLTQQLQAAGWQVQRQTFPSPRPGISFTNLKAIHPGGSSATGQSAPRERPMLLTCHIDTKTGIPNFIGADDGASGAAVLLELARVLAIRHPSLAARIELVFFDGEESFAPRMTREDGLYGSRHDLASRGTNLPRWMINLDMVGGRHKIIAVPMADTSEAMLLHYDTAVKSLGLSPDRWTVYPGSYLDDHLPFAEAGVHTLNLIAYFQHGDWWHTERDDMSRISPASLHETGRLVLQLLRQIME